jgi:hypothetical protein
VVGSTDLRARFCFVTDVLQGAWRQWIAWGRLGFASGSLVACAECADESAAAQQFLDDPANLACQVDQDCAVVGTGCQTFSRGVCQQSQLSRAAAESTKWQALSKGLNECATSCTACQALLLARCVDGLCGGAP